MCIYIEREIYTQMYTHIYIYIYVYMCVYIYIYIHIYIYVYVYMYTYTCIRMYIYIYIYYTYIHYTSLSLYLSIYLSLSLSIYIYIGHVGGGFIGFPVGEQTLESSKCSNRPPHHCSKESVQGASRETRRDFRNLEIVLFEIGTLEA